MLMRDSEGFIVGAGITWRWVYGVGCIYSGIVLILIVLFMEETMYDRHNSCIPQQAGKGIGYRIQTLIGITGVRMSKYRPPFSRCVLDIFEIFWKPAVILPLLYVMWVL